MTPESSKAPSEAPTPSAPGYDLLRVQRSARALAGLSWLLLLLLALAAGLTIRFGPGALWFRLLVSGVMLVIGATGFAVLRVLREVCRTISGLAERQREIAAEILAEESGDRLS